MYTFVKPKTWGWAGPTDPLSDATPALLNYSPVECLLDWIKIVTFLILSYAFSLKD